jgi:hypothetical protein
MKDNHYYDWQFVNHFGGIPNFLAIPILWVVGFVTIVVLTPVVLVLAFLTRH